MGPFFHRINYFLNYVFYPFSLKKFGAPRSGKFPVFYCSTTIVGILWNTRCLERHYNYAHVLGRFGDRVAFFLSHSWHYLQSCVKKSLNTKYHVHKIIVTYQLKVIDRILLAILSRSDLMMKQFTYRLSCYVPVSASTFTREALNTERFTEKAYLANDVTDTAQQ